MCSFSNWWKFNYQYEWSFIIQFLFICLTYTCMWNYCLHFCYFNSHIRKLNSIVFRGWIKFKKTACLFYNIIITLVILCIDIIFRKIHYLYIRKGQTLKSCIWCVDMCFNWSCSWINNRLFYLNYDIIYI